MLKKAKLYSLLAVIVASTVMGLLNSPEIARAACPEGESCVTWSGDKIEDTTYYEEVKYAGNYYTVVNPGAIASYRTDTDFANSACGEAPLVYEHVIGPPGSHIICFLADGNEATFVYFPDKDTTISTDPDSPGIAIGSFEPGKDEKTLILDGDAVDLELAENAIPQPTTSGEVEKSPLACQIKGIGWLICPVVTFLAQVTDQSYEILDQRLLKLEPIALPGGEGKSGMELYEPWKVMRDIANICFIIAFLIIVFSQITSIGVSNYGIKRLLPKIVASAILVNLSYYICVVAVDLSNILGNSLRDLLMLGDDAKLQFSFVIDKDMTKFNGEGWTGIAEFITGAVITGALVYAFLPAFLPLLLSAALAVVTVVIALTLRQALIVILIVISPLAFVSLLLPNTESYFQKWKSLFMAMLLVYPIISVVFGASALASNILMQSTDDFWTQMVGAGVSIIPLFITPIIMKVSGGLLNRWVGIVNDPSKGWVDGKRKSLQDQGKIIKAGRASRTAGWVDHGVDSKIFGRDGSRRRRALTWATNYGSNTRERARKDRLNEAESELESTYLGSVKGVDSRVAANNAQQAMQNAQISAETVRISSAEGITLQQSATFLETRKQTAENQAQTAAIQALPAALAARSKQAELGKQIAENTNKVAALAGVDTDVKIRAATAAQNASNAEGRDKQAFDELAAAGSSDARLLATYGVNAATAAAAQRSSFEGKAIDSAAGTARSEGESQYADAVVSDPALLRQAGGNVNPARGESRAKAKAAAIVNKDESEAITNETETMSRMLLEPDATRPGEPDLLTISEDTSQPLERRIAAKIMIVKRSSDEDIMKTVNYMGSQPLDDEMRTMQQYVFAEIEKRPQISLGASVMSDGKAGAFHPPTSAATRTAPGLDGTTNDTPMDALARSRLMGGKLAPIGVAKAPVDQVKHLVGVLEHGAERATVLSNANFIQFKEDMGRYLSKIEDLPESERPTPEMLAYLTRIRDVR